MSTPILLTPEELVIFKPFCDSMEQRKLGYAEGVEASKRLLLEILIANRPKPEVPNDPDE